MPGKLIILGFICILTATASFADKVGLLKDDAWIGKLRRDHPRLIFNADDLPTLRERAATVCRPEFEAYKKEVDALSDTPEMTFKEDLIVRQPDGTIKPKKPSQYGFSLFRRRGSEEAIRAALLYLITEDEKYAEKAKTYLRLGVQILQETARIGIWADWQGNNRINLIIAYDWIYNYLTPAERREIMLPILDYIKNSRNGGAYKFRRSLSDHTSGMYSESSLQFFAGIAAYGDGLDDALADEMLRRGARLFVDMLDYREELSAGSGLLAASTVTYSFSAYPYATFFFLYIWQSAFGENVAKYYPQMCDYPKWFDYAAIRIEPDGRFLTYGIGDLMHHDNRFSTVLMYTHFAQVIHFFSRDFPEKMPYVYEIMRQLPPGQRQINKMYPFLAFAVTNFEPAKVEQSVGEPVDRGRYLFNPGFGLLLMRSGTGPDDTFAAFRFGSKSTMHQQYDELNFIIYRRGFLAVDSGSRDDTAHHMYYAPQTVAHNSILIHAENEKITPFWKPWGYQDDGKVYFNHGGQSDNTVGEQLALHSTADFIYAAGDATKCYNKFVPKCEEAIRQFVFLKPDLFVVYDRVVSAEPGQKKEILFHTQNQPVKISDRLWKADNEGILYIQTLLPEQPHYELVGGPGFEFYASGRNWPLAGGDKWEEAYQATGKWRIEVSDGGAPAKRSEFLHVLRAALPEADGAPQATGRVEADQAVVELTAGDGSRYQLRFNRQGEVGLKLKQFDADGRVKFDSDLTNTIEKL